MNWLQIVGLKASNLDLSDKYDHLSENEKIEKREEFETNILMHRMIAMVTFFLASMYLTNHFDYRIKQASED